MKEALKRKRRVDEEREAGEECEEGFQEALNSGQDTKQDTLLRIQMYPII